MTARITTIRPERGYSATKYDASVVKLLKTLRRQFGQKYDAKKIRNNYTGEHLHLEHCPDIALQCRLLNCQLMDRLKRMCGLQYL